MRDLSLEFCKKFSCFTNVKISCKKQKFSWVSRRKSEAALRIPVKLQHHEDLRQLWSLATSSTAHCIPLDLLLCSISLFCSHNFGLHRSSCELPCFSLYHSVSASAPTVYCLVTQSLHECKGPGYLSITGHAIDRWQVCRLAAIVSHCHLWSNRSNQGDLTPQPMAFLQQSL